VSNIDLRYEWRPSYILDEAGAETLEEADGYHVFLCRPQTQCDWEHYITLATPTVRIVQPFDENAPRAIRVQGFKGTALSEFSPPQSDGFPVVPLPEPGSTALLLLGVALLTALAKWRKIR
jgi:hypothetical protein